VKVILIRVVIGKKKIINVILESEMRPSFWNNIFFTNDSVIMGHME